MNLTTTDAKTILSMNADWDRDDKAALKVIVKAAESARFNKGYVRLTAEGKTLAWVNPNHVDFPEGIAPIQFSTHPSHLVEVAA